VSARQLGSRRTRPNGLVRSNFNREARSSASHPRIGTLYSLPAIYSDDASLGHSNRDRIRPSAKMFTITPFQYCSSGQQTTSSDGDYRLRNYKPMLDRTSRPHRSESQFTRAIVSALTCAEDRPEIGHEPSSEDGAF
jgi:hypothetical protein